MVVMISPYSASCSEILARVFQYHGRARIIGTHVSSGEVLFSPSWDLPGGGLLKISARDYLDPGGERLQGRGVTPDIMLEARSFFQIRRGSDPALDRAILELTR
jgi:carboxyl-terminal processing protease